MMWRFALGDAEAGIYRPKVMLVFIRYIFGLLFVLMGVILQQNWVLILSGILLILYILWSIWKNYTYVKDVRAFFFLPLLQFAADLAVLSGTVRGLLGKKK